MAEWKVSREPVVVKPHYNADALELAQVGDYQLVVKKGEFTTGDVVLFVPEKSVLPDNIAEPFRDYLVGPDKNRVKSIRLRGEVSCGIVLPEAGFQDQPIGVDISEKLGITKYVPAVGSNGGQGGRGTDGSSYPIDSFGVKSHDCSHFGAYSDELVPGEPVVITEKVHGSQYTFFRRKKDDWFISTKGRVKKGLGLREFEPRLSFVWKGGLFRRIKQVPKFFKVLWKSFKKPLKPISNIYWRATELMGIPEAVDTHFNDDVSVQLFGEVVPCQKGFHYGHDKENPKVKFFRVVVEGQDLPLAAIPQWFRDRWVPVIYEGPYDPNSVRDLAKGKEQVSGQELSIREGVVVVPVNMRCARNGKPLSLKILNPKYVETGEEID